MAAVAQLVEHQFVELVVAGSIPVGRPESLHLRMKYNHIVLGGSFDHLHHGHLALLSTAFTQAKRVTIGLVADVAVLGKKYQDQLQSYAVRRRRLRVEIEKRWASVRYSIMPIHDVYGPSITDASMDAIVGTKNTAKNIGSINDKRSQKGLPTLEVLMVPEIRTDQSGKLSSTRIRNGEINREGLEYMGLFSRTLHLPNSLRPKLAKPLGFIISGNDANLRIAAQKAARYLTKLKSPLCITIGDIVTASLREVGHRPTMAIIDYRSKRKTIGTRPRIDTVNYPGSIDHRAVSVMFRSLQTASKEQGTIIVDGEEDLLVLPAVMMAPLNAVVLYGQPGKGIVAVPVTERKKQRVRRITERFEARQY